ncbi:MAG: hypothetical protein RLZZ534_381 [Actinomycetota bacterium]
MLSRVIRGKTAGIRSFGAMVRVALAPCSPFSVTEELMVRSAELAEKLGLKPRIAVGEGDRKVDLIRNPITFSEGELSYELPPPHLGEHSDEIRKWLKESQG